MKILFPLLWVLGCITAAPHANGAPATTEIAKVRLPDYRKVKLENGMTLLLMERRQLPLISIHWLLKSGGSICDPQGQEGLAMLTAQLLRKGTQARSADQISEAVDFVGGSLEAGIAHEYAWGTAEFVSKDVDLAIDLVSDTLMHPVFPGEEVDKMVKQEVDGIKDEKTLPGQVIGRYYEQFLYGSHLYGRPAGGTEASLPKIGRDLVAGFHSTHYVPNELILAVTGDFSVAALESKLRAKFSSWESHPVSTPRLTAPERVQGRRVLLVERPEATQTFFHFGDVALSRTNSDWVPVQVVNTLFGGRFTSMINSKLRIESGLTYGARSSFHARRMPGPFAVAAYTQNEATGRAIEMALGVLKKLHDEGITEEQLQSVKTYIKGQYGPTLQTNDQLASTIAELESYGLGADYINTYFDRIDQMTRADARRIISQYFPSDNLAFVLVGKADVIEATGRKLGTDIKIKSITEPGF